MLYLYNNKYNRKKNNNFFIFYRKFVSFFFPVGVIDILKTQTLDVTFIVRYILNKNYQLLDEDKNINIDIIMRYQPHINKMEIVKYMQDYSSDDDSIEDFQSFAERNS